MVPLPLHGICVFSLNSKFLGDKCCILLTAVSPVIRLTNGVDLPHPRPGTILEANDPRKQKKKMNSSFKKGGQGRLPRGGDKYACG